MLPVRIVSFPEWDKKPTSPRSILLLNRDRNLNIPMVLAIQLPQMPQYGIILP